jgi:hypothetical protein
METFFNENFFPLSILSNSTNQVIMPTIDILSLGAATQNRNTAIAAFEKMLSHIHPRVLRDLVKIIRLEQVKFYYLIRRFYYSDLLCRERYRGSQKDRTPHQILGIIRISPTKEEFIPDLMPYPWTHSSSLSYAILV